MNEWKFIFLKEQYEKGGFNCKLKLDDDGNIDSMEVYEKTGNLLEIIREGKQNG